MTGINIPIIAAILYAQCTDESELDALINDLEAVRDQMNEQEARS